MSQFEKYGAMWDGGTHPLEIERTCIRKGGQWTWENGTVGGLGMFQHFKNMQTLLWPEDDHHRWSDLILSTILDNRITVVAGCRDSSKTRTVSKWALCDYWCWPQETLILMTSTTAQGLEMRVFGDIKSLFARAKERCEFLEGNVVDAKKGIFTDDISERDEVRDMRKGIVGIPTMTSEGEYQGMALKNFAGIKQKRRRLIGDELQFISCFPSGTMVDTLSGVTPIEEIKPGRYVLGALGYSMVIASSESYSKTMVRITLLDRRVITCTPDHPLLTEDGWIKACEINQHQYILSAYEAMCILWSDVFPSGSSQPMYSMLESKKEVRILRKRIQGSGSEFKEAFLRSELLREVEANTARFSGKTIQSRGGSKNKRIKTQVAQGEPGQIKVGSFCDEKPDTGTGIRASEIRKRYFAEDWASPKSKRRQRDRTNQGGVAVDEDVSRRSVELSDKNGEMERKWNTSRLQSGSCISFNKTSFGSGWWNARTMGPKETEGREEGPILKGSWVASVEILEQTDPRFPVSNSDSRGCRVYNLQVEGHPSYSVNGALVHNCDYLKVLDSMDKGEFCGVFLGNMIADNGKALDRVSEPVNGWSVINNAPKTKTWKNKYNGITVNLCGPDSPNFDPETLNRYDYLLSQADINTVAARPGGKDTVEWWSQIMGLRKSGVVSDRVLTIDMITNNGGFKDVIWTSEPTLKICGVDAGYGGDDCVNTYIECGTEVGGINVIKFMEQKVIPVQISLPVSPEDQIALATKQDCDARGIPYENVYIEAGMRATLAVSFGRILSPAINAINFGGVATDRPVSNDLFIFDERTQQKRLKKCTEHYSKFVTELAFSVRGVVESGQARNFPYPAAEEFQKRKWNYVYGDKYELESKIDYKKRNNSNSPNFSDSVMVAVEGARRQGFQIERLKDPNAEPPEQTDWLDEEILKERKFQRTQELNYS